MKFRLISASEIQFAYCSDHLLKSAWNLELSTEIARGAISALFICIFHVYLFTQKERICTGGLAEGKYVKNS